MAAKSDPSIQLRFAWRGSIRLKLSAVTALLVFLCILLVTAAAAWRTFEQQTMAAGERLQGVATVMANAVSNPVGSENQGAISRVLGSIGNIRDVNYALIMSPDERVIARAGATVFLTDNLDAMERVSARNLIVRDTFWINAPVVLGGETIATLHLLGDLSTLRDEFAGLLLTNALAALLIASVTGIIVFIVIGGMVHPVTSLAKMMTRLGDEADYSTRARVERTDEVGALAKAFNGMLDQIQRRDRDLDDYRIHLEEKVDQRTRALHEAIEEANLANMAKSDFLATMSHEIRTPMNGMMVMAEMLANAPLPAKHRRHAQIIYRSGRSLLAIINDVLDLSKIEAGGIELERIDFSLDTVLDDTVSLFAEKANDKSLALTVSVAPDVARCHIGDPARIGQVVSNLVSNALKFTAQGGINISVSSGDQPQSGRQVLTISVRDTGIGIAPEKQAMIFDAFTQAEQSTTREYGGTGLGLSICRRLAEAMGGAMRVESVPGQGSTFIFELDLSVKTPASTNLVLRGKRFALLTGSAFVRDAISSHLRHHGGDVSCPETAIDAACALSDDERMVLIADQSGMAMADHEVVLRNASAGAIFLHDNDHTAECPAGYDTVMSMALHREALDRLADALDDDDLGLLLREVEDEEDLTQLPDYSRLRVLAVDDNAVNREIIRETLNAISVEADFAESGREAIRLAGAVRYDTIFMDCSMPEMDGFEATRRIRAEETRSGHRAYIAALTAHVGGLSDTAHSEAGMDDYVSKPFTVGDIIAVMKRSTRGGELRHHGDEHNVDTAAHSTFCDPVENFSDHVNTNDEVKNAPLISEQTVAGFNQLGHLAGTTMKANVFGLFITHGADGMARLSDAVKDGAAPGELRDLIHALKSMCASAGAERVRLLAEVLEDQAASGQSPNMDQLAELQDAVNATMAAMQDALSLAPQSQAHA